MKMIEALIGLEDLPENSRVGLGEEFRTELFMHAIQNVRTFTNLAGELEINRNTLLEIKKGFRKNRKKFRKAFIRIKLLKQLSKFSSIPLETIENNVNEVLDGKIPIRMKLPLTASKELASLVGHIFGDGHIEKCGMKSDFVNKNIELINEVKGNIKFLFGIDIKEHFRKENSIFELFIPATIAKIFVFLGIPDGRKTTQEFNVPEWIRGGSLEIKASFIRAIFDDEAWVEKAQGGFCIGFGQNKRAALLESHREFLEEIRTILRELEINSSNIFERSEKDDSIQLGFKIIGLPNLLNFSSRIGFTSSEKARRLNFIMNNFRQIQFGKKEAKLKILEELKNGQMKSKELGERLNRDQKTVWKHLNQLRKRNMVIKIGTKNKVFWGVNNLNNINPNIKQ